MNTAVVIVLCVLIAAYFAIPSRRIRVRDHVAGAICILLLLMFATTARGEVITTMESTQQESQHDFLLRVAAKMSAWTRSNEAELCGLIAKNGSVYSVVLETQHKRDECLSGTKFSGWELTGENIHSHPPVRIGRSVMRKSTSRFSDTDYETPGYLVDSGYLLYQRGVGTETVIAPLHQ